MLGKANVCQSDSLVTVTVSMCCHNNATHCWSRLMHITMNASESTTRYSAFFKSLTVALVIRKTPTLYGAESSCVLTKPCYYTKFSNQFIPLHYLHTLSIWFTLILSSYLCLHLPCAPFTWSFPTDVVHIFSFPSLWCFLLISLPSFYWAAASQMSTYFLRFYHPVKGYALLSPNH